MIMMMMLMIMRWTSGCGKGFRLCQLGFVTLIIDSF